MTGGKQPSAHPSQRNVALVGVALIVGGLAAAKACSPDRNSTLETATSATAGATASAPSASSSESVAPAPSGSAAASSSATARAPRWSHDPNWQPPPPPPDKWGERTQWEGSFEEQNVHMLDQIEAVHGISSDQRHKLEAIIAASERIGQGNPSATKHPVSPAECRKKLADEKIQYQTELAEQICGGRYMAPLYDPEKEQAEDAKTCIDLFEFPNIPCSYPATWVRANEAAVMCEVLGKRLCDAHEWEGACYGALTPPDYNFGIPARMGWEDAVKRMQVQHNINVYDTRRMAYGPEYKRGMCATGSKKSEGCGLGWRRCGSNTYPAGLFPACTSKLGVYDIHGNAAEHMNLPLAPEQMASAPNTLYGRTEMKGSWFIFDNVHAHEDHCRWRAPHWHGTRVMNANSHRNYHLGFRCCKSL